MLKIYVDCFTKFFLFVMFVVAKPARALQLGFRVAF
jgi:hypothetical protein